MKQSRKEAIAQFKERKTALGIFAIRCPATGLVWVGSTRNLAASKNGAWFCLRIGSHIDKKLQSEWNAQGEQGFVYEILETLDEEAHPLEIADLLKQKQLAWTARLDARRLL